MKFIMASALSCALLAACAAPTGENFYRSDTDNKATDVEFCNAYALALTPPKNIVGLSSIPDIQARKAQFKLCMLERGYREQS